jgi:hypothetical protein
VRIPADWIPELPTLILVDYVEYPQLFWECWDVLSQLNPDKPVRILFESPVDFSQMVEGRPPHLIQDLEQIIHKVWITEPVAATPAPSFSGEQPRTSVNTLSSFLDIPSENHAFSSVQTNTEESPKLLHARFCYVQPWNEVETDEYTRYATGILSKVLSCKPNAIPVGRNKIVEWSYGRP